MNNKATKQQIKFPPLLNLADDHPHIDTNFQSFEKQNGPYINNMIFPLYMKDTEGKAVYDFKGSRYEINQVSGKAEIRKDGEKLVEVTPKHFEREYIDFSKYLNYDIDSDYEDGEPTAWSTLEEGNKVLFHYKDNEYLHPEVFAEGSIVRSRCRIMNGNAFFVIYYDEGNKPRLLYFRMDENSVIQDKQVDAKWLQNTIRLSTTASYSPSTIDIEDADPFITMCHVKDDIYGFSLISDYGKILDSKRNGFITFIDNGEVLFYGSDFTPQITSQQEEVTTEVNEYFNVYESAIKSEDVRAAFLFNDGKYYEYQEDGVLGSEILFPTSYQPTPSIQNYVTIDSVSYAYGNYAYRNVSQTLTMSTTERERNWKFTALWKADSAFYSSDQDTTNPKTMTVSRRVYQGETYEPGFDTIILTWFDEDIEVTEHLGKGSFLMTWDDTTTTAVSWLTAPNVFIDTGKMYSLWKFPVVTSSWTAGQLPVGSRIIESANFGELTNSTYSFTILSSFTTTNDSRVVRSNSFTVGQNFWQTNVRLCNTAATVPSSVNVSTAESANSRFMEYMNSNETDLIYFPGMVNAASSSSDYFNYWLNATNATADTTAASTEDTLLWCPGGFRCSLNDTLWRLCYNVTASGTAYINGISYTEANHNMGTLVTPWTSVDVDYYVVANDKVMIYRDSSGNYNKVSIKDDCQIIPLFNDKHIIFNTTSYWNAYDVEKNSLRHYASDYNDRLFFGSNKVSDEPAVQGTSAFARNTASAIGAFINASNETAYASMLPAYVSRLRCDTSYSILYDSISPSTRYTQAVDVFFTNVNRTSENPLYRFSIGPYLIPSEYIDPTIVGRTYSVRSVLLNPDILAKYVDGQGNNDLVLTGNVAYSLTYNNNQRMILLYNPSTGTSNPRFDKPAAFFVLQGQYYGVLDDKIYSLIYSNGVIAQRDAIVDIRGMQFIGNNPMIAFFWSPSLRSIYSFTGDANLQHLYYASKFSEVLTDTNEYFYDESTQTIWVPTNNGLLALGPKNTYFLEDFKDTSLVQISEDGLTHITNGDTTWNVSYYPKDEYKPYELDIESSFWGIGSTEVGSIDRFGITFYDVTQSNPDVIITVGIRSITDITVKSEEKKFHVTPDQWDKWSHAVLINYNPKLIQGQGLRLYVKSPVAVQQITAHVASRGTSQLSRHNI